MEMKTTMCNAEYQAKTRKLKEAEANLNRLILERGIALSHSGMDGETFLSDSAVVTDNQISIQQDLIYSLKQELATAEIIDVKPEITEDGKLKVGYGSRIKMRYFFSDDPTDVEDEYLIICNVNTFSGSAKKNNTYVVCTPASSLYQLLEGQVAGFRGTFKGSISQNTAVQYDFEILEVLPPDQQFLMESTESESENENESEEKKD